VLYQEAQNANRLKDEFLATLSHELRTPMNAIVGWAELLATGDLDEGDYSEAFAAIFRNAQTQVKLINDLLEVSRVITGKIHLDVHTVELLPVIEHCVELLGLTAQAKNVKITLQIDPTSGPVAGDAVRLQQVIYNLIANAVKFTAKDGEVVIGLRRCNSMVEFRVTDNGEGIDASFLPFVFDRFRQADASKSRRHGGLGLGLAIVRNLIELHGGTVGAESEGLGKGATFWARLPLLAVRLPNGMPWEAAAVEPSNPLRSHSLEGLKVLVVDDHPDVLKLLSITLKRHGSEVLEADSSAAALGLLSKSKPDVIVSDVGMPLENGLEFLQRVRKLHPDQGGDCVAIALTAHVLAEDRREALAAGFDAHVGKPVEQDELVNLIVSLVSKRQLLNNLRT